MHEKNESYQNLSVFKKLSSSGSHELKEQNSGTIDPFNIRLQASMLFFTYAQKGAEQALHEKRDLLEWFEKTVEMLESCKTVHSFFRVFIQEIRDFQELSFLLEDETNKPLKNLDEEQLLEQLKQDVSDALSREVFLTFETNHKINLKILRQKKDEMEEIENKYKVLMNDAGLSQSNHHEKEMATAAWRYLMNELPELYNNLNVIDGQILFWKKKEAPLSESQWLKRILIDLDDPKSIYARLPQHIKKGVQCYLRDYNKSSDYQEFVKAQDELIGYPRITQIENGKRRILRISGGHLSLSAVLNLTELEDLKGIDEIQLLATETFFLDKSINDKRFSGMNISIVGKTIDAITKVTINTSGQDALTHTSKCAQDGRSFSYFSSASGYSGENGKSGQPGQSAGNVHIQASQIKAVKNITIIANGGKGGDGQNGGAGDKGQDGENGKDAYYYSDQWFHHATNQYHINRGKKGTLGQAGGNGGDAGQPGQGGYAGQIVVLDGPQDCRKMITISASPGQDGVSGEPGQGGEAGLDGLDGLDAGVAFTGGFCFDSDQHLKGGKDSVYAWLKKGGWFTKDIWRLSAGVSEYLAKSKTKTHTQSRGRMGAQRHYKNAATQKASIDFSAILQQCPKISLHLSATAKINAPEEQFKQKIGSLFVLSNRRQEVEHTIQQVEKEQQVLSEKLQKLQESAQSITNNRFHQRIAQQEQVSQLTYPKQRAPLPDEKENLKEKSPFFYDSSHSNDSEEQRVNHLLKTIFHLMQKHSQQNKIQVSEYKELIPTWVPYFQQLNNQIEQILVKIQRSYPEMALTKNDIYKSLEEMMKMLAANKGLFPEDLTSILYEMSIWHVCEPLFIKQVLQEKGDLFNALLNQPQPLIEGDYKRIDLALCSMQLNPKQLDELRLCYKDDGHILKQLNDYYLEHFYLLRKEALTTHMRQIKISTKQQVERFIENILFETQRAGSGPGYEKSLNTLDALIKEIQQQRNESPDLTKLFQLLGNCQATTRSKIPAYKEEAKADEKREEATLTDLLKLSFPSNHDLESLTYQNEKNELIDFIELNQSNEAWCEIFLHLYKKLATQDPLPLLEELNFLLSIMALRENPYTLLPNLQGDELFSWGVAVLLGNIKEQIHHFVMNQSPDNMEIQRDELHYKVIRALGNQPEILTVLYKKLAQEAAIFDPKLALSILEFNDLLSAFENLGELPHDPNFLSALQETPLPGWGRILRRQTLDLSLNTAYTPGNQEEQQEQKKCLLLLCKLEESFGRENIERLVACICKAGDTINYASLANLLFQLNYQQLTLDDHSLSLLAEAAFKNWPAILSNYHEKEIQKPRNLLTLLTLMQNEAANKKMDILFSKDGNPPLIVSQIEAIQNQLSGTTHSLTAQLFKDSELNIEPKHFSLRAINSWTVNDIQAWSTAFREQTNGRTLVKEHFSELLAVISQAIFLEKKFYPRDTQYLAVLAAFNGSDHAEKIMGQIATGQGKTMTGAMLALLRVFAGDHVDFVTSSSVLAEETESEIRSIAQMFHVSSSCNTEFNDGPYPLQLIEGEISETQKKLLCSKHGVALIKKEEQYFLGLTHDSDGSFIEQPVDLSKYPDFRKKLAEQPFITHRCCTTDGLHDHVLSVIKGYDLGHHVPEFQDETHKLQNSYRSDILCGDLQSFMRSHLLTEFYGKNISQNRKAFLIMDEVDRLLDEMQDILYLSHDIPDMHHLNSLLVAIWEAVHHPSTADDTKENQVILNEFFLKRLSVGECTIAQQLEGRILIPQHLEHFVKRRVTTWIQAAYIAKNNLSKDGEYIVSQMGGETARGVYLVDQDTGVTSRNKELANGIHQFLRLKHQDWPKPLSLKAIFCDPISFLKENYQNGFFGMTGTLGTEQDFRYFEKLFGISKKCIIPRHELLNLRVDPPVLVSSFREQMQAVAKIVAESQQPIEVICSTIADAKRLAAFLKKKAPKANIYTRVHSFESFTKGTRQDPLKVGDVIITTALSGRGTDFHLDPKAESVGLCLIKLASAQHERADKQIDGRTARKGLFGRLIHILCPLQNESSLEEMNAQRDLHQEQLLDQIRKEDLHINRINRQLFEVFSELSRDIEKIIRKTELANLSCGEGYVERQMAALRTHWAMWLDEAEHSMDEAYLRDIDALSAKFKVFRNKMIDLAQAREPVKLVTGALEITKLGIWFGVNNSFSSQSIECFDRVIDEFYPFSGQAMYYKAFAQLNAAKPDDFKARKEAARYLKQARVLLKNEMERLYEPVDRMVALDSVLCQNGQGIQDNQFKKFVDGTAHSLMVHISAIDLLIGAITDPGFFLPAVNNSAESKQLLEQLIKNGDVKGYRVRKKVQSQGKNIEIQLINGKSQEVQFPSELSEYKDKIIDLIFLRRNGDKTLRTLYYEDFCRLIFGEEETQAAENKKMLMKLSWQFLQQEEIISHPTLAKSRLKKSSLDKKYHPEKFTEETWTRALGLLRILDEIQVSTDGLQDLSERGRIPMEVLSFFKYFLEFDRVIRVEKKAVRWSWGATLVLFWSVAQISAGILLACPALIQQGIGDVVFLAMSAIQGNFSMENYLRYKRTSIATAALSIAGKSMINWIIKSAEKYVMANPQPTQRALNVISFAKKVSDAIPAPVLMQQSNLSFFSQFRSVVGEGVKQTTTQASMQYLLTTFSQTNVEKHVQESLVEKFQLEVDELAAEVKSLCMEVLEYSASLETAERIILSLFESTLREHLSKKQNTLNFSTSLLTAPDMGKILGEGITSLTGKKLLGNLTGGILVNLDKIGAITRGLTQSKSMMNEVKQNLTLKLNQLKSANQGRKNISTEESTLNQFIDEEIKRLKARIANESLRDLGSTILTPIVRWTCDRVVDFASKGINNKKVEQDNLEEESNHQTEENNQQAEENEALSFNRVFSEYVPPEESSQEIPTQEKKGPDFCTFAINTGGWPGAAYYKAKMKGELARRMPELAYNKAGDVHCCTIAASYAARLAGWKLPKVPGKTISWEYEGETCHAFYRVRDFVKYIEDFLGPPIQLKNGDLIPENGIKVTVWGHSRGGTYTSYGHVSYFDKGEVVDWPIKEDKVLYWPWSLVVEKVNSMNNAEEEKCCPNERMNKPN